MQLLLENAVKHNIVSDSRPLKIRIYEDDSQLVVENNLQEKAVVKKGSGVGLKNIASRYGLLTSRKMGIDKNTDFYRVHVPILNDLEIQESTKTNVMNNYNVEDVKLVQARERVKEIKHLYDDVFKTVGIISILAIINYFTSDFPWVIFPALGMSIGLLFQFLRTTDQNVFLGRKWEERSIKELIEKNVLTSNMKESYKDRYTRAKNRVGEIGGFYHHLLIYVVVNIGIASFNFYLDQWRTPWFLFPLGGWGIGLLGHAIATFNLNPLTNKDWEEKMVQELLEKEK